VELNRASADNHKLHTSVLERPDEFELIATEPWTVGCAFHLPGLASIVKCRNPEYEVLEGIWAIGKSQSASCYNENKEGRT
jgi:hypothetical protein